MGRYERKQKNISKQYRVVVAACFKQTDQDVMYFHTMHKRFNKDEWQSSDCTNNTQHVLIEEQKYTYRMYPYF